MERDHVTGGHLGTQSDTVDGEGRAQHSSHIAATTGGALTSPHHGHQAGAGVGGEVEQTAVLQLLDLLMLFVLLSVRELDHQGAAAPLHGEAVVHGLDGEDGDLSVGEGDKCTA